MSGGVLLCCHRVAHTTAENVTVDTRAPCKRVVAGMSGNACIIVCTRHALIFINNCRPTVGLLSPNGWAVATVVAAVDAHGAVVLAGAAFKASDAPSALSA